MSDFDPNEVDRFQKIEQVFLQVCDLPRQDHDHQLKELCGDDTELISNVRSMLQADEQTCPLIDSDTLFVEVAQDDHIPERIGEFEIIRVLGEGGMGIVYEAIQGSPKRHIALKVIRQRSMHSKIRKRFEREADILAKLNHPAIATIYESGIAQDKDQSTPFVSMELVIGKIITKHCEHTKLDGNAKIELIRDVCRGVGYAHDLGIIHRDLKPSNILVDSSGQVKILDFGIAFDMEIEQRTQMTQTGQFLGTLQYMAPEQVDQHAHATNKQTDVYALGLICYELLIGENPLARHDSSMYELVRAIRDEEHDLLGTHDRSLRGDIETIVAKALSREIDRRYIDANALADDFDRYLSNQPIAARKPGTWYQLRKFSKRNPLLAGSITSVMIVLVVAILLISNALQVANRERKIARHEQEVQLLINAFVTDDLFAAADPNYGGDANISLLNAMRKSASGIDERFANAPEAEAAIRFTMGDQFRLMGDYDEALIQLTKSVEISEPLDLPIDVRIDRRNSLSDVYMDIDDLETALKLVEVTNQMAEGNPDVSTSILIDTLVQHASLLFHMRRAEESAMIFEQAVEIGREELPNHDGTIDAISALAIVYTFLERYEESIKLHDEGIRLQIQTLGEEYPSTLVARDNLAILYYRREEYQRSADDFRKTLEVRNRVFGQDHVKTYMTASLLGRSLSRLDKFEEAEHYLVPAYEGALESLGPNHRYTKIIQSYVFKFYTRWEKSDIAEFYAPQNDP